MRTHVETVRLEEIAEANAKIRKDLARIRDYPNAGPPTQKGYQGPSLKELREARIQHGSTHSKDIYV